MQYYFYSSIFYLVFHLLKLLRPRTSKDLNRGYSVSPEELRFEFSGTVVKDLRETEKFLIRNTKSRFK